MAIDRKWVAQHDSEENQWLKVDHSSRYIVNHSPEWQPIFNLNSTLSTSSQIIKIAAKFDEDSFSKIKVVGYLYDTQNASIANASTGTFNYYKVYTSTWDEQLLFTESGILLSNNYFYKEKNVSDFAPLDIIGGDTLMIEATIVRLGVTYRDRIYVNLLGIYDNVTRLRQDVDFLDITKQDE
jgi:hypothetical protein